MELDHLRYAHAVTQTLSFLRKLRNDLRDFIFRRSRIRSATHSVMLRLPSRAAAILTLLCSSGVRKTPNLIGSMKFRYYRIVR